MGKGAVQDEGPPGDREMTTAIFGKKQLAKLYYLKLLRLEKHSAKTQSQYFPNIHSLPPSSREVQKVPAKLTSMFRRGTGHLGLRGLLCLL